MKWSNIVIVLLLNTSIVISNIEDAPTVEEEIIELLRLKQGTEQFNRWVFTPMDINFKVYIFNVENVDDIMNGATPIVREVGPYIYKKYREKRNIKYNEDDDTLEYEESIQFEFNAEASAPLTEDDKVTVLNVQMQDFFQNSVESALTVNAVWPQLFQDTTTLFHEISIKNLLFDGYRFCDPSTIEGVAYIIARLLCSNIRSKYASVDAVMIDSDSTIVFSIFGHKLRRYDGPYVIKAGNLNILDIGSMQTWKNEEYMESWQGVKSTCNEIRGTDGLLHPPFSNNETAFEVFNPDICRVETYHTKHNSSFQGIDSNVANLDLNIFSNENHEECYCTNATENPAGNHECFPSGFGDMLTCMNYRIITSLPHFLSPDVENHIIGLTPKEELHASSIMIEPNTGWILEANKRMQYNMVIRPIENIAITENVSPVIMPILWFEEIVKLPDDLVEKLNEDFLSKLEKIKGEDEDEDGDEDEDNDPGVGIALKPQSFLLTCIYGLFIYTFLHSF